MAQTQKKNQGEVNGTITEQLNIIAHIQEILNIQRQYINGHESSERQPVNLRTVINDCLAMLFASFDKAGIIVSLHVAVEKPVIKGDRTKLMQLILNILKNSIEAIDKNSEDKQISIAVCDHADSLIIHIKDSGAGFDKDISSHLFSKGFSTKAAGGLGLYNCRTILESHDATINLISEGENKGAVATVRFRKQEN